MPSDTSISIVIPAFNEEKLIGETMTHITSAVKAFTGRGWGTEVILCDNNSSDRTAELARAAGAKVVFEPFNQIGRARNTGAAAATGEWLLFIDADSHPSFELLSDVAEEIATGTCLAGGSTVLLAGSSSRLADRTVFLWNCLSRTRKLMAGSFIFCETAAFKEIGGFDARLFAGEEIDLSTKLKKVARRRKKRVVILHRHPLLTSARKLHLYRLREHLGFIARTVFSFGRTIKRREACFTWYDGRR